MVAVSGVGLVIETQPARIGVTTYCQIARFSSVNIERVNEALGVFHGRTEREDGGAQAARLHHRTNA